MKKIFAAVVALGIILGGCAVIEDSYVSTISPTRESVDVIIETETRSETTAAPVMLESLSFKNGSMEANKGDSINLNELLNFFPENANTYEDFSWNINIAEGMQYELNDGIFCPLNAGEYSIKVFSGSISASLIIDVKAPLKGVSASSQTVIFDPSVTYDFIYSIDPEDTTDVFVPQFNSSNPEIISIDDSGKMRTNMAGHSDITVVYGDYSAVAGVDVRIPATDMFLSAQSLEIKKGMSEALGVALLPLETTDSLLDLKYVSSDESVVRVENGILSAVGSGNATITVSANGFVKTCEVMVPVSLEGISFEQGSVSLLKGQSIYAPALPVPSNCNESYSVVYASDNTAVAVTDGLGNITAVGAGSCSIVAVSGDFSAVMQVNVLAPLNAIALNYTDVYLAVGDTLGLAVGYDPFDTTDERGAVWASDNSAVATVNGGVVTALATGSCNILAQVGDKVAACHITVIQKSINKVVVLDPGHGAGDGGASSLSGISEKTLNLTVALYCRDYLLKHYNGVDVYMTRETDTRLAGTASEDLGARVNLAQSLGADIYVALHFNSSGNGSNGALICTSSSPNVSLACDTLGVCILQQLQLLGLNSQGLYKRLGTSGLDYYFINRECSARNIPGIIVEHCFLDSPVDLQFYDSMDDLMRLAEADAKGIAQFLGLTPKG